MAACKNIAIIRRNGLGDVLCALPLVYYCKKQLPESRITLIIDERAAALSPYLEGPDEVFSIRQRANKYASLLETAWRLKNRQFDIAISAKSRPMKLMNLLLYGLKASHRLAYTDGSWSSGFINCSAAFNASEQKHQALRCLNLVDAALTAVPKEFYPRLKVVPIIAATVNKLDLKAPRLFVSVSNNRIGSLLDNDKYARLLNALPSSFSVMINCEPKDEQKAVHLKSLLLKPSQVVPTSSFDDFLQLAAAADSFFIGDGGIMHIAAALDKPQVVLFGGTKTWEWAPLSDKAVVLSDQENVNFISEGSIYAALETLL